MCVFMDFPNVLLCLSSVSLSCACLPHLCRSHTFVSCDFYSSNNRHRTTMKNVYRIALSLGPIHFPSFGAFPRRVQTLEND